MAEKKPNIRFKGFEEEWEDKSFADAYKSAAEGGTPSTSVKDYYVGGSIPFVKIEDTEQKYIHDTASHITEKGMNNSSAWLIPSNSIIFTNGATIGNVAINKVPVTTKQGILGVIQDTSKFDLEYLYYALSTDEFQTEVEKRQSKGTFATIILRNLDKIDIPHTSLPEQRKIGEFFKQLDELIGAQEQEYEKLRQIKLALLDKMFPSDSQDNINGGGKSLIYKMLQNSSQLVVSSPAPNTPTIRFRGFTEPWEKYLISRRVTYGKGRGYSKANLQQSGTPILLYGTLYTDYNTNITEVDRYSTKKEWAVISKGNEVVVPASGETAEDIARASAILKAGIILGGDLNIIYPDDKLDASFLALELTYGNSHRKLVKKAQGISVVHLHNTDISELEINVPSYNEQRKIGDFFRSQDEAIANSQLQINKLKTIKQACLSQMFA